jgi:hypothetical protein
VAIDAGTSPTVIFFITSFEVESITDTLLLNQFATNTKSLYARSSDMAIESGPSPTVN